MGNSQVINTIANQRIGGPGSTVSANKGMIKRAGGKRLLRRLSMICQRVKMDRSTGKSSPLRFLTLGKSHNNNCQSPRTQR